jgi:hypothetical protein
MNSAKHTETQETHMPISDLLQWQWQGYLQNHQSKLNLLLHLVAVPLFLAANTGMVWALFAVSWVSTLGCACAMLLSLFLQGRGHQREPHAPAPFTGLGNALSRLLLEQWITFPRFVFTGQWWRALRQAGPIDKAR